MSDFSGSDHGQIKKKRHEPIDIEMTDTWHPKTVNKEGDHVEKYDVKQHGEDKKMENVTAQKQVYNQKNDQIGQKGKLKPFQEEQAKKLIVMTQEIQRKEQLGESDDEELSPEEEARMWQSMAAEGRLKQAEKKRQQKQWPKREEQIDELSEQQNKGSDLVKEAKKLQEGQKDFVKEVENQNSLSPLIQKPDPMSQFPGKKHYLFKSKLYKLNGQDWQKMSNAKATENSFAGISIASITKMKIKAESKVQGTRLIKVSTSNEEHFFSVLIEDQIQWMSKILWAKLTSMGKTCSLNNDPFSWGVDGEILKKGFFGGWDTKIGRINNSVFEILPSMDAAPEKSLTEVPEIWTRFQIVNGNRLVVKMHHFAFKLQVGVPVDKAVSWMRALFHLIK